MAFSSDPQRDRQLARQVRYGPRFAQSAERVVDRWLRGPELKRLRRNRRIAGALRSVLSPAELDRVEPVAVRKGTLTLAVSDSILLSELRNHRLGCLIAELVDQGTGINRVVFRVARRGE